MRRREFIVLTGGAAIAWSLTGHAQQPAKVARIGFLGAGSASGYATRVEALRAGLRDLGYMEGKNIAFDLRWAEGSYDRLPHLAAELVHLNVDVIVTHSTPGTRAAKNATMTIPIVMAVSGDAIATGLVDSLAKPGGNITGTTYFNPELMAKRLELIKEALPSIVQAAVLLNPDNSATRVMLQAMQVVAHPLNIELHPFYVRATSELEGALLAVVEKGIGAVVIQEDPLLVDNAKWIAELARKHRVPSIAFNEIAQAGGLIGYGVNFPELYRHAAVFVDKILKGAKPSDLPIEQPTKFELIINLKTAKVLGLTVPPSILLRADEVIE